MRTLLSVAGLVLALVVAVNYTVDPLGRFGSPAGLAPVVVVGENQVTRDMLQRRDPPDVLVVGSSHAESLDANYLRRATGMTAYNAYVAGARVETICAVTRFAADRFGRWPKVLIIGADVASFYGELDDVLVLNTHIRPFVPYRLGVAQSVAIGLRSAKTTLEWTTLLSSLRAVLRACGISAFAGNTSAGRRAASALVAKDEYVARYQVHAVDPERVRWLTDLVCQASHEGIQVVLFLTPLHPDLDRVVREQSNYPHLQATVWSLCVRLAGENAGVHAVDLSTIDKFGGDPNGFRDGVHTTDENGRRMADRLVAVLEC